MKDDLYSKPFDPATVTLEGSNLIEASAGTGKTYSIAILALRLVLEKKISIQQILMVTFTKAAVAELETRIRQFMRNGLKVAQGKKIDDETITSIVQSSMTKSTNGPVETERLLKDAVLFLDETAILTIHGFSQRVLTEFAFETRQVFSPEILTDTKALVTDLVNDFWRSYITTMHTGLLGELLEIGLSRIRLIGVIENAIGGKVLLQLSALPAGFLSAPHQIELYENISGFNTAIETIRTDLLSFISANIATIRSATEKNSHAKKNMGHLLADPSALLEAIVANGDKVYVQKTYADILEEYKKITEIEGQKSIAVKTIINQVHNLAVQLIKKRADAYKRQHNQLGFDDMIMKLHAAVVKDTNQFLIASLQTKYKAAFIDEFQDTDKMQYEIFNRLFGDGTVLFYIGDPKQSIYAWRKADIFTYFKAAEAVENRFGMNINYRSSRRFIESMNAFFLPEPDFDTFYFSGEADAIQYIPVSAPAESLKPELHRGDKPDSPITLFSDANNEAISETVVAQIIRLLSSDEYFINNKGERKKITPSDIGILVRKNKQATAIKRLLSKYGIPAVTIDDSKLLQSGEARDLLYLLAAVIDITPSSIRKALLSPLTGYFRADILAMDDELALGRFKGYQQLWEQEGIYIMITRFLADYKVKRVLLDEKAENGERVITNLLQLMEVLHKVQTQKQFAATELVNWLKRGIEGMQVEGDEFEQRVESDEASVKIVTIHKSKGLEYKIVFAPFLDLLSDTDFEFVTFRDEVSGDYIFSDASLLSNDQLRLTAKQLEQENRRLIYVAITRAVYKCYINKNAWRAYNQSAITPFIEAVLKLPSPLISFEPSPALPENFRYTGRAVQVEPAYLRANDFLLKEVNWRKLSYTYLDAGHTPLFRASTTRLMGSYDEFIFKLLRRGVQTGNLLHYIFERIDFTDNTHWEKVITDSLKRFIVNQLPGYFVNMLELLQQVTAANININGASFQLSDVKRESRLNELEFDFNVGLFQPEQVNALSTAETPFQLRYAKELEGIMNGKIDMFFEHGGRYFILDWKSNYLGDQLPDYSAKNIQAAMTESNYHLQYLTYTLAVRKYLQLRLPEFDYARHFGGVIYLFVRGIRKGRAEGIFTHKPDEGLIDRLEEFLMPKVSSSRY